MIIFLFTFLAYFGITLHNFSFVWAKYWAIFKPFSPQPFSYIDYDVEYILGLELPTQAKRITRKEQILVPSVEGFLI